VISRARVLLLALVAAACTTQPLPAGNLADPSALVVAPTANLKGGSVVMIAEGDGEDLRAFAPANSCNVNSDCDSGLTCNTSTHLCPGHFIRGPNAISALSVPLASTMNGQTLPSFRAQRLAAAGVPNTGGAGTLAKGYVVAVGASSRVAVVDTQTFRTTVAAADATACAAGPTSLSCLPVPALDVATTPTKAFVLLSTDTAGKICTAGHQCVLALAPSVAGDGSVVLTRDAQAPIDLGTGQFVRMRIGAGLTGPMIYVTDASPVVLPATTNPQGVVSVSVDGGALTKFATVGPVNVAAPTPDGKIVLAVLGNGSVESLDVTTGVAAVDSLHRPLVPLDLIVPAVDVIFLPCNSGETAPCQKTVRTGSGTTVQANTAVLGMGDGTAIPLFQDATTTGLFRPVNLSGDPAPGAPGITASDAATAALFSLSITGQTLGVTHSETFAVVNNGILPAFAARPGTITGMTLTDTSATFDLTQPAKLGGPQVGDIVRLHTLNNSCPQADNAEFTVTAGASPTTITVAPPAGFPCNLQNLPVAYDVLASDSATAGAWVVTGSFSGFLDRFQTPTMGAPATFSYAGERFYYPSNYTVPATTCGPTMMDVCAEPTVSFSLTRVVDGPVEEGANFFFTTSSGLTPFALSSSASANSLAISLAALNDTLYVAILGANSLTEIDLPSYTQSGSVTDYR
jgi:hypothetical protein